MIFLTVGTQLPFDRLVETVDAWAAEHPEIEIFGQIGKAGYRPKHFRFCDFLDEDSYAKAFDSADFILAHAGMGTIISALMVGKPVLVYPRIAALGEHRNEHQLATCRRLSHLDGCYVAYEKAALLALLDNLGGLSAERIPPHASNELLATIDDFILASA